MTVSEVPESGAEVSEMIGVQQGVAGRVEMREDDAALSQGQGCVPGWVVGL